MDSIYALSSGAVPSGVAVIRISGPKASEALKALAGGVPEPRRAALRNIRRPDDSAVIDQGLVLWFPRPRSETGEDMAELQVHGGRAVVQAIFDALGGLGLRLARPGEFIRRAFENGKLDLTEVEGLADLIAAETEMQRRQAFGQARGALAERAEAWRETLIDLRAEIEARLDFSDESDVAEALPPDFGAKVAALAAEMNAALAGAAIRRAAARGVPRRDPRAAECREVVAPECARAPRRGDRHGGGGNDAGRARGAARSRRLSGSALRHRGPSRSGVGGRDGGRPPRAADGRGRRPGPLAGGRHEAGRAMPGDFRPADLADCDQDRSSAGAPDGGPRRIGGDRGWP